MIFRVISSNKKPGKVRALIDNYLLNLEDWLNSWRLNMAANKCNVIRFEKRKQSNNEFKFKLYGNEIPHTNTIKFLGITFDKSLSFKDHFQNIKQKCVDRINIIKIISYKTWKLKKKTLLNVYKSLIRSIIDYSSFIIPLINTQMYNSIQAIQNNIIIIIFKQPWYAHTSD